MDLTVSAMDLSILAQLAPLAESISNSVLQTGFVGAILIAVTIGYMKKDAALQISHERRVEDAKRFGEVVSKNSETIAVYAQAVQALTALVQSNQSSRSRS